MKPKILKTPSKWYKFYEHQKLIADILLKKLITREIILCLKENNYDEFTTIFINAHYHWGMAIENGLKGIIIEHFPEKVKFKTDDKNIIIESIGGRAGKTHNLYLLANEIGIFDINSKFYVGDNQEAYLSEVLKHLSDAIKWASRYPISMNTAKDFTPKKETPLVLIYGFHILDVMQPLFELIEKQYK